MYPNTVLSKTAKGQEEVVTRQHGLKIRLRALLIPVNGVQTVEDIIRTHPAGQQAIEMMQRLLEEGFVEVVEARQTATPVPQAAPVTISAGDAIKATLVRRYLIEFVGGTLGFMGEDIIKQIQETDDLNELKCIAHSCTEVVSAIAGQGKAQDFQAELDKLIG